ncbi:proline-rich basic protein 1 [Pelodiscus sinensis]|uniref:proline-rich basic protein 1 n=1 Tax=Pelodiscus sinensis TaxID=13735 RepID=UPI003F6BC11F
MIPVVKNTAQFSRPAPPPTPDGLLHGEGHFQDSECKEAASEKNNHTPGQSQGDPLKDTSDSSVSSYHTAPGSEGAESFKDCVESLDSKGGDLLPPPPDGDPQGERGAKAAAPGSFSERNPAGREGFRGDPCEDAAGQLHGAPRDRVKAAGVLPDQTCKGAGPACAAASTAVAHSALTRPRAERTFGLRAGRECVPSTPGCRDGGSLRAKEKQPAQLSITAKNSSAPGPSGRTGLATRELPLGNRGSKYLGLPIRVDAPDSRAMFLQAGPTKGSSAPGASKATCPPGGADSDSEEADSEVQKLTALSFRSLSCPYGGSLAGCSSSNRTSSSWSSSLSDDSNGMNRWPPRHELRRAEVRSRAKGSKQFPLASQVPEKDRPSDSFGTAPLECVAVAPESADGRRGPSQKRTVPKRQIQLKPRDREEMSFLAAGDRAAHQPFAAPRKEPCPKRRTIRDEFRLSYKQFMRTASSDDSTGQTRMASCLVKNVLAKKMQYEQRLRTEQKSREGGSTSSGPSSVSTDLVGDFPAGKSSSFSRTDCSRLAEDLLGHSTSERPESVAMGPESPDALQLAKGVVLSEQQREPVCKLKKTFNELNERLREADQSKPLPILADGVSRDSSRGRKQAASERKEFRRARALFESMQASTGAAPTLSKAQKPWPSLKQRAICKSEHPSGNEGKAPVRPRSPLVPGDPASSLFTSTTPEVKLIPQSAGEQQQKTLHVSKPRPSEESSEERPAAVQRPRHSSLILPTSCRSHHDGESSPHAQESGETGSKGAGRIHHPRDVRKLVKNTYSLCFQSSDSFPADQEPSPEDAVSLSAKECPATSPLFIHCSSVRRKVAAPAETPSQDKSLEQPLNVDVSALATPAQSASGPLPPKSHVDGPVRLTDRTGAPGGGSPVHIAQIQSRKKVVTGKEDPRLPPDKKPAHYERSEFNVAPAPNATRKAPPMESQLNIKVNSRLSKHPHKPHADPFSAPAWPASGKATKDSSTQANCRSLEQSETFPFPVSASFGGTKGPSDVTRNAARPGHFQEAHAHEEPEWPSQKHLSTETISFTPHDSQAFSVSPQDENQVSEPGPAKEGYRHRQAMKPPGTSTQPSYTNTPANSQFVPSSYQQKAQDKVTDAPGPVESRGLVPATRMSPERASPCAPLRAREHSKGTGPPGVPAAAPFPPAGKRENWDGLPRPQAGTEQYFTATHAENANYLTMPAKAPKADAAPTPVGPSQADHALPPSGTVLQPGAGTPPSTTSCESPPPRAPEGKAAAGLPGPDQPSRVQPHRRADKSPRFLWRSGGVSPGSQGAPSPTRASVPQPHRKMLVDPESGKCYYMEPPRQPQLKLLYDPDTGQYIEVLLPPVPLASHGRLYPSPCNPLVMNPGVYGAPYMPYPGFPGFPPPPVALPSLHPDLPNQQAALENVCVTDTFSPGPKGDAPPAPQASDCNYMESVYYIPTGMNPSPSPSRLLFSPATSSSPSMPEKGPLFQM